jgi:hypothetical protein
MLGHEPQLQLVPADHIADQQIVASIVSRLGSAPRHCLRFFQDDLVRITGTITL